MRVIFENDITAFVADNQFRKRDVRFDSAQDHKKKRVENWKPAKGKKYFSADEFVYDERCGKLICPGGYAMKVKCRNLQSSGYTGIAYIGERKNCRSCSLRSRCIRKATTQARQVSKFDGVCGDQKISFTELKQAIDSNFAGHPKIHALVKNKVPLFGSGDKEALAMARKHQLRSVQALVLSNMVDLQIAAGSMDVTTGLLQRPAQAHRWTHRCRPR